MRLNIATTGLTLADPESISILLVEDDGDDAIEVRDMLKEPSGQNFDIDRAHSSAEARVHIDRSAVDCVLLDLSLPDARGLDALTRLRAYAPDLPIVVLSGTAEEGIAVNAIKEGAQNYLVKGRTDGQLLRRSISYAIERKHAELDMAHEAMRDPLTGLPNRGLFLDRVRQALARSRRHGYTFAVFFLDLNGFKAINDSRGHKIGDQLLVVMARRLEEVLRESDTAARFGGDEFTILCENVFDERHASDIAERLIASIEAPITAGDESLSITTSLGIGIGTSSGAADTQTLDEVAEALVRDADLAMYRAKELGTAFEFFDSDMRARIAERSGVTKSLEDALRREEFCLLYQPQVEIESGRIVGVEALLRWQRPGRSDLIAPAEFLNAAEEMDLIIPIGDWVLRKACRQTELWRDLKPSDPVPMMAINLSQKELSHPDLVNRMRESLSQSQTDPTGICIEITERISMIGIDFALQTLQSLKALGVTLAVDDFGTGHASLADLKRFPFDVLKIDGSFVAGLGDEHNLQDYEIVASTIRLAHGLGMTVVAEGVETKDQLGHLRSMGCDVAQGYYLSRPTTATAVNDLHGSIEAT